MTMLAETVDAIIEIDTHRDSHEVEIADVTGKPIALMRIGNDSGGFAQLLAAIAELAPGPRVAVLVEGSRSYGIGLARTLTAAGLLVIECGQPARRQRRGKGKSDPIDAHLAVLAGLRMDTSQVPELRADGDREALRILLGARQEITVASTAQVHRLRALLLAGDDADRQATRTALTTTVLQVLAQPARIPLRPRPRRPASRDTAARARAWPGTSRAQGKPRAAGGHRRGHRPRLNQGVWHRTGQRRPGHRELLPPRPVPHAKPRSPRSAAPARSPPAAAAPSATGLTAAVTGPSTAPST